MKIGMLCYSTYGGSGVVATQLGQELARRGHEIHFICAEKPFRLSRFQTNVFLHQVESYDYPLFSAPPYFLMQVNKIVEVARACELDLLHAHYAIPHAMSGYLARQILGRPLPMVTTLHGTDITLVGGHQDFYETTSFSLASSEKITAVSHWLAKETDSVFDLQKNIAVIHNFINPEEYQRLFDPALRLLFAQPDEKLIIHISNFRPVKKVEDVVEIFELISASLPAKLILVGDGPSMPAVQKLVYRKKISDHVYFLGKQDQVVPLLSIADLFLMPSEKESFGLAALEALACEVPVVASAVGGLPEVVAHGKVGFTAPPGAVEEMARWSIEILSRPEYGKLLSLQARQHVLKNFTCTQKVQQYEDIYNAALEETLF